MSIECDILQQASVALRAVRNGHAPHYHDIEALYERIDACLESKRTPIAHTADARDAKRFKAALEKIANLQLISDAYSVANCAGAMQSIARGELE